MNRPMMWGLTAVLAMCGASLGCAQTGQTIRGQSPVPDPVAEKAPAPVAKPAPAPADVVIYGPLIGSAPGYGEHAKANSHKDFKTLPQFYNNNFGYEGGYYTGPEGYYTYPRTRSYTTGGAGAAGGCPYCQYGAACPADGCPQCGHGCPHHNASYQYNWPQNMVYPQGPVPAGMVQWPYYTLRGPTDFFMK